MSDNGYLAVMVGVIMLTTIIALPPLLFKRCPDCGKHCLVDTRLCGKCGHAFPDEDI